MELYGNVLGNRQFLFLYQKGQINPDDQILSWLILRSTFTSDRGIRIKMLNTILRLNLLHEYSSVFTVSQGTENITFPTSRNQKVHSHRLIRCIPDYFDASVYVYTLINVNVHVTHKLPEANWSKTVNSWGKNKRTNTKPRPKGIYIIWIITNQICNCFSTDCCGDFYCPKWVFKIGMLSPFNQMLCDFTDLQLMDNSIFSNWAFLVY